LLIAFLKYSVEFVYCL